MPEGYTDPLLGELLVRFGVVDRATIQASLRESKSNGSLQGRILLNQGLPDPALRTALKKQARDRFSRFLRYAGGICSFHKNRKLGGKSKLGHPLDPIEECRRNIALMYKSCTDNLLQSGGDLEIKLCTNRIPNHLLKYSWERCILEDLYKNGSQTVTRFLANAPDIASGILSFHFLKEMNVIQVANPRIWYYSQNPVKNPYQPDRSQADAVGSQRKTNTEDMEESLKRWWRTMARRYHPDKHMDAAPEIRRLFAQRFAEARDTYRRCLKHKVLPEHF